MFEMYILMLLVVMALFTRHVLIGLVVSIGIMLLSFRFPGIFTAIFLFMGMMMALYFLTVQPPD